VRNLHGARHLDVALLGDARLGNAGLSDSRFGHTRFGGPGLGRARLDAAPVGDAELLGNGASGGAARRGGKRPGRLGRPGLLALARRADRSELETELELHEVDAVKAEVPGLAEECLGSCSATKITRGG